jgi:ABC-type antimicrobial peptide transport system permease subunit
MSLLDVFELALGNLRLAWLRTLLTTLGVAIGVGALVGMVSFGAGLQQNLNARLLKNALFQSITVFPQPESRAAASPSRPLDAPALAAIRQIAGVKRADPDVRLPLRLELDGKTTEGLAIALPLDSADEAVFQEMPKGHFFSAEEAPEIILGTDAAKALGVADPESLVGKSLTASVAAHMPGSRRFSGTVALPAAFSMPLTVVGIVNRERAMFGGFGSQFYVPYRFAEAIQEKVVDPLIGAARTSIGSVAVRLESARDLDRVEQAIGKLGFRTLSIASAISQLRRVFLVVDALLALVGSIGLAVACLGITNTMVMAVLERTREIGIMKAVGAEDRDILRVFCAESAAIGALGGLLGLLLAWGLGHAINAGANWYFARQGFPPESLFQIPLWLVGSSLAFAVGVSVASGLYPAVRASRIDPTRALRHD